MGKLSLQLPIFNKMGCGCMLPMVPLLSRNLLVVHDGKFLLDVRSQFLLSRTSREAGCGGGLRKETRKGVAWVTFPGAFKILAQVELFLPSQLRIFFFRIYFAYGNKQMIFF